MNELTSKSTNINESPPSVLYKYVAPERLDILETRHIRFTQATALNDPFELKPIFDSMVPDDNFESTFRPTNSMLEASLREQYQRLPAEMQARLSFEQVLEKLRHNPEVIEVALADVMPKIKSAIQTFTPQAKAILSQAIERHVGVLSLAESPTNQAMWAHYGKNHQGFLIGFRTSDDFFNRKRTQGDDFFHLRRVRYLDRAIDNLSFIDLTGNDIFFTKGTDWSYEREWRMLALLTASSKVIEIPDDSIHLFEFPASAMCEVVIGARASIGLNEAISNLIHSDPALAHVAIRRTVLPLDRSAIEVEGPTRSR